MVAHVVSMLMKLLNLQEKIVIVEQKPTVQINVVTVLLVSFMLMRYVLQVSVIG